MGEQQHSLRRLRKRAESALANGRRGADVLRVLETIVRQADDGTEEALFAHRQLAELKLERSPWQAALHLRQLVVSDAADDGVHALMGLCQALLSNFRAAIACYRRAVAVSPRNPWYHHNLGHLLDVGLGASRIALPHLRIAHEIEGREDEITASLAHCLARVGELDEARALARRAIAGSPDNAEHRALLRWVEQGAPAGARDAARRAGCTALPPRQLSGDAVERMLADSMRDAGFSRHYVRRAQVLWRDYCGGREQPVSRPEAYAAAIEYAMAKLHCVRGVTQAQLARRYGVGAATISSRYGEIRSALALVPGDPRYL
jgi:Flp pilus assembly protein TadD